MLRFWLTLQPNVRSLVHRSARESKQKVQEKGRFEASVLTIVAKYRLSFEVVRSGFQDFSDRRDLRSLDRGLENSCVKTWYPSTVTCWCRCPSGTIRWVHEQWKLWVVHDQQTGTRTAGSLRLQSKLSYCMVSYCINPKMHWIFGGTITVVAPENNLSDICTNCYNIQSPEPGREWKIREMR